jgi:uncharacterized protein (UPF0276 family)
MRHLGVGLIYLTEVDQLFREENPDLAVLELEPETFWEKIYPEGPAGQAAYLPNAEAMSRVAALPQKKLVHSVGFPVGGTARYDGDYVKPLAEIAQDLHAPWASAHLSFNTISTASGSEQVGFLLPPRQTREGVELAVHNIRELASGVGVPFAFETGVNYLKPRADELSDGAFFAAIAEGADCGILLDLHNLWANERNGRQSIESVLEELPLDRVWEMHLAGGMELDGYYLDAHSGGLAPELVDIASRVIPRLPNLGAMMFEIQSAYFPTLGLDGVREQLALMNELWRLPRNKRIVVRRDEIPAIVATEPSGDIAQWEATLAALAVGHPAADMAEPATGTTELAGLADDPAIAIFNKLIGDARSGQIGRALHFTTILMLASWGPATVRALLDEYQSQTYPDTFAAGEGDRFARFLASRLDRLPSSPYIRQVLGFEHALVRAALYGERATVQWEIDPVELFDTLEQGRVPATVTPQTFAMEIVPQD